ncbi:MAG: hypothetical protein ACRDGW_13810 [Actinomycetota bacterium]
MDAVLVSGLRGLRLHCRVPRGRRERLRGLIGLGGLAPDEGFLIANATSVHTFGMRFPILVARLDGSFRVVDVRVVRRWRFVRPIRRARHVLECHEGADVRVGDPLHLLWCGRVRREVGSAGERADERQDERRTDRQRPDHDREETARPRGERDGLSSSALRLDDPEELQQEPHR